ncbi:hypothetical protein [Nocardia thailandica]|uniref:hypothetical protein n=1 Tax=Nocardia thailandica TaxID=257275 RepID=UPI0005B88190|nr:hypothetical protein [Nocardia thailandica]
MRARVLDRALRVAVTRAGAPGGIRFTERQLYYEVCRVVVPVPRGLRRPAFTVPAAVRYTDFRAALDAHGPVTGLLTPAPPRPRPAGAHTEEPDLFDYGLPRLLVCESHAVAEMLRANGVPMESACPVYSAAELPLDPRVTGMLARVDDSAMFLLHDASVAGMRFPERLRTSTPVPEGVRVVPLGLRPRQAGALHATHLPDPAGVPDPGGDAWESAWSRGGRRGHRGRRVDVEAVRPAALLRTVHRLVREVRPPAGPTPWHRLRATGFLTWPTA